MIDLSSAELAAILTACTGSAATIGGLVVKVIESNKKAKKEKAEREVERILKLEKERDESVVQMNSVGKQEEQIKNLERENARIGFELDKLTGKLVESENNLAEARRNLDGMTKMFLDYTRS